MVEKIDSERMKLSDKKPVVKMIATLINLGMVAYNDNVDLILTDDIHHCSKSTLVEKRMED